MSNNKKPLINVGPTLRQKRKQKGLTLKQLAERSGLSLAYISHVERGQAIPSLMSLLQLTEVLDVSMDQIIKTQKQFKDYRKADELEPIDVESPVSYFRLSNPFPNQQIDPLIMQVPPHFTESSSPEGEGHDGEGFIYIIEGELIIRYNNKEFTLSVGDNMHYDLKHTLRIHNPSDKYAKMLWVGSVILF